MVSFFEVPFLLLAVSGLLVSWWQQHPSRILIPVLLFFPLLHTVYLGSIRYRIPIVPLLALFAGLALGSLRKQR
jgi:hypothetical protein